MPAEELEEFNEHIAGRIEFVHEFHATAERVIHNLWRNPFSLGITTPDQHRRSPPTEE